MKTPAALGIRPAFSNQEFIDFSPCLCDSVVKNDSMSILRLKIDVSGTVGDAVWRKLNHFEQIQSADFGPQFGSGGRCNHAPDQPHGKGEWIGAEIRLQTPLLAQYAMSHYLEQERVLDADVE